MKDRYTTRMLYGATPIIECEWEIDSDATDLQKAIAAVRVEEHLTKLLNFEVRTTE